MKLIKQVAVGVVVALIVREIIKRGAPRQGAIQPATAETETIA